VGTRVAKHITPLYDYVSLTIDHVQSLPAQSASPAGAIERVSTSTEVDKSMGVDHGGGEERGDCPPDFVMLQNFKHQITYNVGKCVFASTAGLL